MRRRLVAGCAIALTIAALFSGGGATAAPPSETELDYRLYAMKRG
jgi:hypothetical protein